MHIYIYIYLEYVLRTHSCITRQPPSRPTSHGGALQPPSEQRPACHGRSTLQGGSAGRCRGRKGATAGCGRWKGQSHSQIGGFLFGATPPCQNNVWYDMDKVYTYIYIVLYLLRSRWVYSFEVTPQNGWFKMILPKSSQDPSESSKADHRLQPCRRPISVRESMFFLG